MQLLKLMTAGAMALALSACASASFKPYEGYDSTTKGLRLPERKPLVVLMGNTVSIQWVCNNDKGTAMQFGSFLAKHHMKATFDTCGGMSALDSDQDSTAVPLKLIEVIGAVAQQTLPKGQATSATDTTGKVAFQIFDVRFDYDGSISLVPLVHAGDVMRIDTGTGTVSGGLVPGKATSAEGDTPAIPGG